MKTVNENIPVMFEQSDSVMDRRGRNSHQQANYGCTDSVVKESIYSSSGNLSDLGVPVG